MKKIEMYNRHKPGLIRKVKECQRLIKNAMVMKDLNSGNPERLKDWSDRIESLQGDINFYQKHIDR